MNRFALYPTSVVLLVVSLCAVPCRAQTVVRPLAPGVLKVIPPEYKTEETFQGPIQLTNVTKLDWQPHFWPKTETLRAKADETVLRRNIWNLEFAFKPLRMVNVDIPQPDGKMQRALVWYMVYRVRNKGKHLTPVANRDPHGPVTYASGEASEVINVGSDQPLDSIRFFPHFVLQSVEQKVAYMDRVIPAAVGVIRQREMRGGQLYNSVDISRVPVPVSTPDNPVDIWGVATWTGVEPRIDYFSVFVKGLTNAYRLVPDQQGKMVNVQKTLQLNFWRPGDAVYEHESEVRFGVPAVENAVEQSKILLNYNLKERVDYLWVYR